VPLFNVDLFISYRLHCSVTVRTENNYSQVAQSLQWLG